MSRVRVPFPAPIKLNKYSVLKAAPRLGGVAFFVSSAIHLPFSTSILEKLPVSWRIDYIDICNMRRIEIIHWINSQQWPVGAGRVKRFKFAETELTFFLSEISHFRSAVLKWVNDEAVDPTDTEFYLPDIRWESLKDEGSPHFRPHCMRGFD